MTERMTERQKDTKEGHGRNHNNERTSGNIRIRKEGCRRKNKKNMKGV
jgi:hypothetical protein